jgi:NADH-quinone oxidoreductase subunit E
MKKGAGMLTEEERQEIITELKNHRDKRSACFEAMRTVQRRRGWVSDELHEIAKLLDMTSDELDSVATFYTFIFRRPVGKHIIYICDSVSCWIMGHEDLLKYLKSRLAVDIGGTTADGKFTLLPVSCLGACDHAPVLMLDDELYNDLTKKKIDKILKKYGD